MPFSIAVCSNRYLEDQATNRNWLVTGAVIHLYTLDYPNEWERLEILLTGGFNHVRGSWDLILQGQCRVIYRQC